MHLLVPLGNLVWVRVSTWEIAVMVYLLGKRSSYFHCSVTQMGITRGCLRAKACVVCTSCNMALGNNLFNIHLVATATTVPHTAHLPRPMLSTGTGCPDRLRSLYPWKSQKLSGHWPGQPALSGPAWAGGLEEVTSKVPSYLNHSLILWKKLLNMEEKKKGGGGTAWFWENMEGMVRTMLIPLKIKGFSLVSKLFLIYTELPYCYFYLLLLVASS